MMRSQAFLYSCNSCGLDLFWIDPAPAKEGTDDGIRSWLPVCPEHLKFELDDYNASNSISILCHRCGTCVGYLEKHS